MSTINLLNLNVDTLFEQHSVPNIDIIQKKIQGVVENKREELRNCVGERYRDLLQAADTIASMQTSAGTLIAQIDKITTNCRSLNEQQLIGFKSNDAGEMVRQRNANKELNNYFSTMVQIKLLTSLPEMIWSKIDEEHFYVATELFIFSRHISTGLQLDANNILMQHLPVARKQWEILKPFHLTIKQCVISVLEREDLSAEVAADCLLSLLLLEKSSLNGVIKTFLQLRCSAYLACLSENQASDETALRRVKERILASLKVLNGTMELLARCLLENGLLFRKLAEHTDSQALPTISLMHEAEYAHLLPEIIANFRPKFDVQPLDKVQAAAAIEQWLTDTKRIADVQLKSFFGLVSNMSTIQEIKAKANEDRKHLDFEPIVVHFSLKQALDFYEAKYVPLINKRVRDIIESSWTQAMNSTFQAFVEALPNDDTIDVNIWQEQPGDLPPSLEVALSEEQKRKNLLMKTKGYDIEIIKLCTEFDKQLAAIVAEMNVLLKEQTAHVEDKLALVEFLRETSQQQLNEFLTKLKSLNLSKEQRKQLLFVVRICTGLVELCPHLKICFCQQASWRQWIGGASGQHAASSLEQWQRMCALLEDETLRFWLQILEGILEIHNCDAQMPTVLTHEVLLEDFVHWESISLEQKDEQDNPVTSSFRIPNQPRISLQSYLFGLIHTLNISVPQTLPTKVLNQFNGKLLAELLRHYEGHSVDKSLASNQCNALQLYFDLKFLHSIFQISREDRLINEKFQALQSTFKDFVDPFDFELFAEHIATNVKRSVSRLNCQLGVLVPQSLQANVISLAHEKDPNLLSLSTTASSAVWFPLLPIVTSNVGPDVARLTSNESEKAATSTSTATTSTTPTRKSTSSRRNNDANQKSKTAASSFFGAMSQEWFR